MQATDAAALLDEAGGDRIGAGALPRLDTSEERFTALARLGEAVESNGSNTAEAAFVRLLAILGEGTAEWRHEAARYLREHGHRGAAVLVQAFHLARWEGNYETARLLLLSHRDQTWAKAARLRLAIQAGRWELIAAATDELMRADLGRLLRILLDPARDPEAPSEARVDAYRLLLWALEGRLANRGLARILHREWIELSRRCA
jgi:hypothetical protein